MALPNLSYGQCSADFTASANGCNITLEIPPALAIGTGEFTSIPSLPTFPVNSQGGNWPNPTILNYPATCGTYEIKHTVYYCASGPITLAQDINIVDVFTPRLSITHNITNPSPSCDETSTITYTICRNQCLSQLVAFAENITFLITVPTNLLSVSGVNFSPTGTANQFQCTVTAAQLNALGNGGCLTKTVTLTPLPAANGQTITIPLTAQSDCVEFNGNLNTLPAINSTITPAWPELTLTKTVNALSVSPGGTLQYIILITNNGEGAATENIIIVDDYDETVMTPASLPPACVVSGGVITQTITQDIQPGQTIGFTYNFNIHNDLACRNNITNRARITSYECGSTPWDDITLPIIWAGTNAFTVNANTNLSAIPGMAAALGQMQPIYIKVADGVTLTVAQTAAFPMGSAFEMGANARITVSPNQTLTLPGCHLYACDELWEGIRLLQKASLISNGSLYEHAISTIIVSSSAYVHLTNNIFRNNIDCFFAPNGVNHSLSNSIITHNEFTSDIDLLDHPHPTTGAVYQRGKRAFFVFNTLLLNLGEGNVFHHLENGIVANRSNVTVFKCRFGEIELDNTSSTGQEPNSYAIIATGALTQNFQLKVTGYGVNQINFSDCLHGIRTNMMSVDIKLNNMHHMRRDITIVSTRYNQLTRVLDNRVEALIRGIALINCDFQPPSTVSFNDIDVLVSNLPINNNPFSDNGNRNGILVANCTFSFSQNSSPYLLMFNNVSVSGKSINGIHMIGSTNIGAYENDVHIGQMTNHADGFDLDGTTLLGNYYLLENTIVGDQTLYTPSGAISYQGTDTDPDVEGIEVSSSKAVLYCNDIDLTYSGVGYYGGCGFVPHTFKTFSGQNFGRHNRGLFVSASGTTDKQINTNSTWGPTSNYTSVQAFTANPTAPDIFPYFEDFTPPPTSNLSGWMQDGGLSLEFCPTIGTDTSLAYFGGLDERAARGDYITDVYADAQLYIARRNLLAKIEQVPTNEWIYNPLYTDFVDDMTHSTANELHGVQKAMSAALGSVATQYEDLTKLDSTLRSLLDTLTLSTIERLDIEEQIDSLNAQADVLHGQIVTTMQIEASAINTDNSAIQPSNDIELFEQALNDAMLQSVFVGVDTFTQSQLTSLSFIAELCPLEYGNAVYQARAILALADEVYTGIDDDRACENSSQSPLKSPVEKKANMLISPNPANYLVTISLSGVKNPEKVQVYNAVSGFIAEATIQDLAVLDCSDWSSGLYLLMLFADGRVVETQKLSVIRR